MAKTAQHVPAKGAGVVLVVDVFCSLQLIA
jgi:hypothetical protein